MAGIKNGGHVEVDVRREVMLRNQRISFSSGIFQTLTVPTGADRVVFTCGANCPIRVEFAESSAGSPDSVATVSTDAKTFMGNALQGISFVGLVGKGWGACAAITGVSDDVVVSWYGVR